MHVLLFTLFFTGHIDKAQCGKRRRPRDSVEEEAQGLEKFAKSCAKGGSYKAERKEEWERKTRPRGREGRREGKNGGGKEGGRTCEWIHNATKQTGKKGSDGQLGCQFTDKVRAWTVGRAFATAPLPGDDEALFNEDLGREGEREGGREGGRERERLNGESFDFSTG